MKVFETMRKGLLLAAFFSVFTTFSGFAQNSKQPLIEDLKYGLATVIIYDDGGRVLKGGRGFFLWPGTIVTKMDFLEGAYHVDIGTADGKASPVRQIVMENRASNLIVLSVNTWNFEKIRAVVDDYYYHELLSLNQGERVTLVGVDPEMMAKVFKGNVRVIRDVPSFGKVAELSTDLPEENDFCFVLNKKQEVAGISIVQNVDQNRICFALSFRQLMQLANKIGQYKRSTLAEWNRDHQGNNFSEEEHIYSNEPVLNSPALLYLWAGNCEKALPYLKEIVNKYPNSSQGWLCLGYCHDKLREWPQTVEAYERALTISPSDSVGNLLKTAYLNLGDVYLQAGDYPKAVEIYQKAGSTREQPNLAEKKIYEAYMRWGDSSIQAGRYMDGIDILKKVAWTKEGAKAYCKIGMAYDRLGLYQEAIFAYMSAVSCDSNYAEARYQLCLAFLNQESKTQALENYKILKSLDKNLAKKLSVFFEKK